MSEKKSTTSSKSKTKKSTKKPVTKKEIVKEEVKEEKKVSNDTTSLSVINTKELNHLIEEDLTPKEVKKSPRRNPITHFVLILTMIVSLISFGVTLFNKDSSILSIITHLLITIFTILFVVVSITYNRSSKKMILASSILLIGYFLLQLNGQTTIVKSPILLTPNFSGKSITEVMKWADQNKVTIEQEYEYSDMVPEYSVISQNIQAGTSLKDIDTIIVSISEGPNPAKEIMIPSMISWNSEKVLEFIKNNYLSNVQVEFEQSDKAKDTVISQSASGSLKRNDELKLVFSYGEELGFSEVTLEDLTGKSEFEVVFYMKQHQLNYHLDYEFDKKIKKGFAIKQGIKAGEIVPIQDKIVGVTISKGPEIKVPDFTDYSMTKVAEWAIQNKVKINFEDEYDDTVKEGSIIRANYKAGDIIEQGTIVKITLSRGSLKMPKLKAASDFYDWATKYNIQYEEKHEFSDTVPAGEVISYSYKAGQAIKNNDTVIVTISDGKKMSVPNVVGMTRKEAQSKMSSAGLNCNFVYRNSSEAKDKVLGQSIKAGSEVSEGTTVTITLSNGKKESNNNGGGNSGGNNNSGGDTNPTPQPDPDPPQPTCENVTVWIDGSHIKNNPASTCSTIKNAYPSLHFTCSYTCGPTNGLLLNGDAEIDAHTFTTCDTISLVIADNDKC